MEIPEFDERPRAPRPIEEMRAHLDDLGRRIADAQAGRWPGTAPWTGNSELLAPFTADQQ